MYNAPFLQSVVYYYLVYLLYLVSVSFESHVFNLRISVSVF